MRHALIRHPDSPDSAASHIEVEATRPRPDNLVLTYIVTGRIGDLLLPSVIASTRADALWQHTCFEAFLRAPGEAYHEYNFAPSTQWAAYRFSGYRQGMSVATAVAPPGIETRSTPERLELRASLALHLPTDGAWCLALSAVIEETSGRKSYWALAHPPGKPDFHHGDGFALELLTS
ncbi:MAG: DOMON-like domain-containing protein [Burkholderiales bacterium]